MREVSGMATAAVMVKGWLFPCRGTLWTVVAQQAGKEEEGGEGLRESTSCTHTTTDFGHQEGGREEERGKFTTCCIRGRRVWLMMMVSSRRRDGAGKEEEEKEEQEKEEEEEGIPLSRLILPIHHDDFGSSGEWTA